MGPNIRREPAAVAAVHRCPSPTLVTGPLPITAHDLGPQQAPTGVPSVGDGLPVPTTTVVHSDDAPRGQHSRDDFAGILARRVVGVMRGVDPAFRHVPRSAADGGAAEGS